MRRLFLVFAFIGILSSCSKDEATPIKTEIIGKWNWVQSSGGIGGDTSTPETTGNQITIEFTESVYKKYINGNLDTEMPYKVETGNSIWKEEKTDIIIYEDDWKQSIELKNNKLILSDECFDCYQNEYIRKEN